MDNLKREITIKVNDEKEQLRIGNSIHEQLVGNKDYIDSNIILNIDEENIIKIYIFNECESVPNIVL